MEKELPSFFWLLAICAGILSCTFLYPYSGDNAQLLYTSDLMLRGIWPYRSVFFHDFPGVLLLHSFQLLFLDRSLSAFHCLDIAIQLLGAWLLFRIVTYVAGEAAGWIAAIFWCFYYVLEGGNMTGQRDTYVSIMLLAIVYLFLIRSKRWLAWSGLLAGMAVLFRPTYGLHAVAIFGWLLWSERKTESFRKVWTVFLPFLCLSVFLFLVIALVTGTMGDLYEQIVLFNFKLYNVYLGPMYLAHQLRAYGLWVIAFAVGIGVLLRSRNRPTGTLLLVLVAAEIIEVLMLSQTNYQLHPLVTLFILGGSAGWIWLWDRVRSNGGRSIILGLLLIGSTAPALRSQAFQFYDMTGEDDIIHYLRSRVPPGSMIQSAGALHAPFALAANPASRFIMLHALVQRNSSGHLEDFQLRWRAEFLHDLKTKRPLYFLMHDGSNAGREFLNGQTPWEVIRNDMPAVGAFLDSAYHIEKKIGRYTLYRRNSP